MRLGREFYLVPISLVELVFKERLYREFQVWMKLKDKSDGKIKITKEVIKSIADDLKVSEKTVQRAFKKLAARNWIGYNSKTDFSYIRGFKTIQIIEDLEGRLGVWMRISKIDEVRGFISGAVISKLVRHQKRKAWQERMGAETKGAAIQPVRLPAYYPISCSSLNQIYDVSIKAAWIAKTKANEGGFILLKHQTRKLPSNYLRGFPIESGRIFWKNGTWYERKPDLVGLKLTFGKRRLNSYCKQQ